MKIDEIQLDESNQEFYNAAKFVENTNRHLFLTGKAGTGKTTFLKYLKTSLYKNSVVLAYTGVAAVNAGGNTINSFFKIRPSVYFPEDKRLRISAKNDPDDSSTIWDHFRLDKRRVEIINALELMIIDEVSMLRCDLLDVVDKILRAYRKSLDRPFGGVQVVLLGDLFQLPPIAQYSEWEILSRFYKTPFFFSSKAIEQLVSNKQLTYIELKKIYRQKEMDFVNLLNRVRLNEISDKDLAVLNQKYNPTFSKPKDKNFITLTTYNRIVDQENKIELEKLPGDPVCFEAEISGNFPDTMYPTNLNLELKTGAQVMFLKNDMGEDKRYYNGKIGKLTKIGEEYLLIETEDDTVKLQKHKWENIRYEWDKEKKKIVERIDGTFTQFPLKLAWAVTVHKSQGLTFENVVADLGGAWDSGQVYVALSRCTSYNGLVLKSKISRNNIKTDEDVISFSKNETPGTLVLEALKEHAALEEKSGSTHSKDRVMWETKLVKAEEEDKKYGCIVGRHYTLLVAQNDGISEDAKAYKKGDWLIFENDTVNQSIHFEKKGNPTTTYESVKIGNQVWMKRNLDVSHFRNGDPIPEVKTDEEWVEADKEKKPAWCYYDNDPENGKRYGKLYNWYAVNDPRGLAPKGWHVAGDNEWQVLVDLLGGEKIAGGKMKTTGPSEWENPNEDATDSSGFSGLPGGQRNSDGYFSLMGKFGNFWSSTENSTTNAWSRYLGYYYAYVNRDYDTKGYGFSVRCVRDDAAISNITMLLNEEFEYEIIRIGDQEWMKRNLDVSLFRNGDPIPEARTDEEWEKASEEERPAWCYYDNNPENGKKYGKLYNWYAVNDPRGLAPKGWHVPSDNEWQVLVDYLGGREIAGGKMKSIGTSEWKSPNEGATNSSGFSGLPGGGRRVSGNFNILGSYGGWWSSSEDSSADAWHRGLHYSTALASRNASNKELGFSVRCVRD